MSKSSNCIVCQKSDEQVPVVKFKFKGKKYGICSEHMPILIHKAQELESMLPGIPASEE